MTPGGPGAGTPDDRLFFASDSALEAALADLAGALEVPATPDMATAVRVRLGESGPRRSRTVFWLPGLRLRPSPLLVLLALAALLVLAGVAAAIALGLPGLRIIFSEATPSPTPFTTPTATATPVATASLATTAPSVPASPTAVPSIEPPSPAPVDLGTPATLAAARASVTFPVFVPDAPELGDAAPSVYLDSRVAGGAVVLAYPAGGVLPAPSNGPVGSAGQAIGIIVTESRATVDEALLGKVLGPGTTVEHVRVRGQTGLWISGRPHTLLILDASGDVVEVPLREVGDVLAWVEDGTLVRVESPLDLAATLRIAESMR